MTAHTEWAERILSCKDDEHLEQILNDQEESLKIYKKATDQLIAFNDFSTARFTQIQKHLETHTKLIKEIKTDLDAAFLKIRALKQHCQEHHPSEHEKALQRYPPRVVEDD
ncbi:hypothetical protein BGW37DRAFT_502846 [Umbelopsis sp. PMI_123]|nr:hypothetical protein BGW37DRAFT_502846 [Umbelopsis sp. PMI_123]